MPHKKAKKSTRDSLKAQREKESNLAPGTSKAKDDGLEDDMPKSAARIFNAERVRKDWNERKRKEREGEGQLGWEGSASKTLKIKPGEHIRHFNQRVEDDMRADIREATLKIRLQERTSKKKEKRKAKASSAAAAADDLATPSGSQGVKGGEKGKEKEKEREREFSKSTPVNRVTDIVEAPPELTSLPRLPKGDSSGSASPAAKKAKAIVSLAQKARMEEERERAIQRYREMREGQRGGFKAGDS